MTESQISHCRNVLERLEERGIDVSCSPLTRELVRAVIATGDELINETVLEPDGLPCLELDEEEASRAFHIISRWQFPCHALGRVQMIMAALDRAVAEELAGESCRLTRLHENWSRFRGGAWVTNSK